MLLEQIERLGSISAAARAMKLTFRNAWLWIEAMNRLAPSPLVLREKGGTGGGSARLTEEGRQAVAGCRELRSQLENIIAPAKLVKSSKPFSSRLRDK